jgi:hypothetical protein
MEGKWGAVVGEAQAQPAMQHLWQCLFNWFADAFHVPLTVIFIIS